MGNCTNCRTGDKDGIAHKHEPFCYEWRCKCGSGKKHQWSGLCEECCEKRKECPSCSSHLATIAERDERISRYEVLLHAVNEDNDRLKSRLALYVELEKAAKKVEAHSQATGRCPNNSAGMIDLRAALKSVEGK